MWLRTLVHLSKSCHKVADLRRGVVRFTSSPARHLRPRDPRATGRASKDPYQNKASGADSDATCIWRHRLGPLFERRPGLPDVSRVLVMVSTLLGCTGFCPLGVVRLDKSWKFFRRMSQRRLNLRTRLRLSLTRRSKWPTLVAARSPCRTRRLALMSRGRPAPRSLKAQVLDEASSKRLFDLRTSKMTSIHRVLHLVR